MFFNRAPIIWSRKKQNLVQTSTFGSEFIVMDQDVEMFQDLRYKLRMFGIPIDSPANMQCGNEAVYNNATIPKSVDYCANHML